MDKTIQDLTEKQMQMILYGTGEEKYLVKMMSAETGAKGEFQSKFEGVIPNLERRF